MKKLATFLSITLVLTMLFDVLSKQWVERIAAHEISIAGQFIRLNLNYNTGIAFGLFQDQGLWPTIVIACVVVVMVVVLIRAILRHTLPVLTGIPVGLILGGAIANLIDRLPDGRVTDFLDVGLGTLRWPTFNLADCFIVVGVILLLSRSIETKIEHTQLSVSETSIEYRR